MRPLILLAVIASIAACASPRSPERVSIACRGSQEGLCRAPLCMDVEEEADRVCTFCRCSEPLRDESQGYGWRNNSPLTRDPQALPPMPVDFPP